MDLLAALWAEGWGGHPATERRGRVPVELRRRLADSVPAKFLCAPIWGQPDHVTMVYMIGHFTGCASPNCKMVITRTNISRATHFPTVSDSWGSLLDIHILIPSVPTKSHIWSHVGLRPIAPAPSLGLESRFLIGLSISQWVGLNRE